MSAEETTRVSDQTHAEDAAETAAANDGQTAEAGAPDAGAPDTGTPKASAPGGAPGGVPGGASNNAPGGASDGSALAEARAEAVRNLEGWQRTLAEFQNYKRRTEKELLEGRQNGAQETIKRFFPIIDDFERALSNIPEELKGNPWMNGVELILRNFHKILDEHNITILDPVGEMFDPNRHEAVGMDDNSELESGTVTVTLQKGYSSGDRILRPALVRVAQ